MSASPAKKQESLPDSYPELLCDLKDRVQAAQLQATLTVNAELIQLYWDIGNEIQTREAAEGWGSKVVNRLSDDLKHSFPEMKGFSKRNLLYMRDFARAWPVEDAKAILQHPVAKLPLTHNTTLITAVEDRETRLWYAAKTVENGWSRAVLRAQIASKLHERQGAVLSSFSNALAPADSELIQSTFKDPYKFEFLRLAKDVKERDLEDALIDNVQEFLLEMGDGFAFVGRQYELRVPDEETGEEQSFFIDLLFYNYILRRFVVIDLKIDDFKPEFAGKMQFYITAIDEQKKHPDDEATIGLIICPGRNATVAKWALKGVSAPVGVARYTSGNDVIMSDDPPVEIEEINVDLPALEVELTARVAKNE